MSSTSTYEGMTIGTPSLNKFSYKKMLLKGVKYFVCYGVPYLVAYLLKFYPGLMSLSFGTVLSMFANFLKVKYGMKI